MVTMQLKPIRLTSNCQLKSILTAFTFVSLFGEIFPSGIKIEFSNPTLIFPPSFIALLIQPTSSLPNAQIAQSAFISFA